jgi:hypothetical protein
MPGNQEMRVCAPGLCNQGAVMINGQGLTESGYGR